MQGHHHGDPLFPGHSPENGKKLQLVPDIQVGCRFVEDDDLRFLANGPRQQDPLALAVADRLKGSRRKFLCVNGGKGFLHLLFILLRQDPETSCIRVSSHGGYIPAGHELGLDPSGQHHRHFPCQFFRGEPLQAFHSGILSRVCLKEHVSPHRDKLPGNALQDRGFSRAVGSDQRHDLPAFHADLNVLYQRFPPVAHRQMIKMQMQFFHFLLLLFLSCLSPDQHEDHHRRTDHGGDRADVQFRG